MDAGTRRIVVGPRNAGSDQVRLGEVNWLIEPPTAPLRCTVKLRARATPEPATIMPGPDGPHVRLDSPGTPAPGQACVFYDSDRILGGGFIRRAPADSRLHASQA